MKLTNIKNFVPEELIMAAEYEKEKLPRAVRRNIVFRRQDDGDAHDQFVKFYHSEGKEAWWPPKYKIENITQSMVPLVHDCLSI